MVYDTKLDMESNTLFIEPRLICFNLLNSYLALSSLYQQDIKTILTLIAKQIVIIQQNKHLLSLKSLEYADSNVFDKIPYDKNFFIFLNDLNKCVELYNFCLEKEKEIVQSFWDHNFTLQIHKLLCELYEKVFKNEFSK